MTPETARAERLLSNWKKGNPFVVDLARTLSLAVQIEPWLLRRARLRFVRGADASVEASLWFSPLVASRGGDAIELNPAVAECLRAELGQDQQLLGEVWGCVHEAHTDLSELLRREEELTWLGLRQPYPAAEVRTLLGEVYKVALDQQRRGVAAWAVRALPRLPKPVRDSEVAQHLLNASRLVLQAGVRLEPGTDWVSRLEVLPGDPVQVGVTAREQEIEIEEPPPPGASVLAVPRTEPLVVEASWDGADGRRAYTILLPERWETVRAEVERKNLRLRLADDSVFDVRVLAEMGRLFNVPALPAHWMEGPEVARASKALGKKDATLALTGAAGVGKTALAIRLARDHDVRQRFTDGIYWIDVGARPSLEDEARALLEASGSGTSVATNSPDDLGALLDRLRARRCLLVLDDVRRPQQLDLSGISTLLTTRDPSLASWASTTEALAPLTLDRSLDLLAGALSTTRDKLPAEAREIAELCLGSRLALSTHGARLLAGESWAGVLESLRAEQQESAAVARIEELVRQQRLEEAQESIEEMLRHGKASIRVRRLAGLVAARTRRPEEALRILGELYDEGHADAETIAACARIWKERYEQSGSESDLRRSRELYAEGFELEPDSSYFAINAAATSVFLGDLDAARQWCLQVQEIVERDPKPDDYWQSVTGAAAHLIRGDYERAAQTYRAAAETARPTTYMSTTALDQANELMEALGTPEDQRALIRSAFGDIATAGESPAPEGSEAPETSAAPRPPLVYLSYAHADREWAERLRTSLRPLEQQARLSVWTAVESVQTVASPPDEIDRVLREAVVAVVLVSPNLLDSAGFVDVDLPLLEQRASAGELTVVPIAVSHVAAKETVLSKYRFANDEAHPLESLDPAERDRALLDIARRVADLATPASPPDEPATHGGPVGPGYLVGTDPGRSATICCLVRDRRGETYLLTSDLGERRVGAPYRLRTAPGPGQASDELVATFSRGVVPSLDGSAFLGSLARVVVSEDRFAHPAGSPEHGLQGVADAPPGKTVRMLGGASGGSEGEVSAVEVVSTIATDSGSHRFDNLFEVRPRGRIFSAPGDGGAPVVDDQWRLVGMLVAGTDVEGRGPHSSFVASIKPVLRAEGLELYRPGATGGSGTTGEGKTAPNKTEATKPARASKPPSKKGSTSKAKKRQKGPAPKAGAGTSEKPASRRAKQAPQSKRTTRTSAAGKSSTRSRASQKGKAKKTKAKSRPKKKR